MFEEDKKRKRLGSIISLVSAIIALIVGFIEAGWAGILIVPLYFIALLGTFLSLIPFIGVVLYAYGVSWVFNQILSSLGLTGKLNVSTAIIFYSHLVYAGITCLTVTSILLAVLFKRRAHWKL